ncbi:hypothetical protein D9M68_842450 [compost metagenome]
MVASTARRQQPMKAFGQGGAHGRARRQLFAHDGNRRVARHQRAAQPHDLRLEPLDPGGLLDQQARATLLHPGVGPQQHGMFLHREVHGGHSR